MADDKIIDGNTGEIVKRELEYTDLEVIDASDYALSMDKTNSNLKVLKKFVDDNFKEGEDFGAPFPGSPKNSLLLAGAEKFNLLFNVRPHFVTIERITDTKTGFCLYHLGCELVNKKSGQVQGYGEGSCNTYESKIRYRNGERVCPTCGKNTIIKGKAEYGGGWLCYSKKGGCGAKFSDGDESIESQVIGKVENDNLFDQWNNALKIAEKRAMVCAVVYTGGVSGLFTQDGDDYQENEAAKPVKVQPIKTVVPRPSPKGQSAVTKVAATTAVQSTASDASVEMVTLSDGKTQKPARQQITKEAAVAFNKKYVIQDKKMEWKHLVNHVHAHFGVEITDKTTSTEALSLLTWEQLMAFRAYLDNGTPYPPEYAGNGEEDKKTEEADYTPDYLRKVADSLGVELDTILKNIDKPIESLTPEQISVMVAFLNESPVRDVKNLTHILQEALK